MKLFSIITTLLSTAPAATENAGGLGDLVFNPTNFVSNLQHMGVGMLVIFVVIGVIIVTTMLINKIFSHEKKDDE